VFFLKKLLGEFLLPLPICLTLLGVGVGLLWRGRAVRAGKVLVTLGTVFLAAFSLGVSADLFVLPLESAYPPRPGGDFPEGIKWVVVMGGGHRSSPDYPPASQMGDSALRRLVEGISLCREIPGSRLLFSGGKVFQPVSCAALMAQLSADLGVDSESIVLDERARDTWEETSYIQERIGTEPFIVVTSASHMPRTVSMMRKRGMKPIPVTTDHRAIPETAAFLDHLPGSDDIGKVESAFHEYLGLFWARIWNQVEG